ncbi:multidrug transporter [Phaeosphaeriaceae sp. PMI808]|nr:multidrug transporter [Phaeosphaeriaceae sp. PMI808]
MSILSPSPRSSTTLTLQTSWKGDYKPTLPNPNTPISGSTDCSLRPLHPNHCAVPTEGPVTWDSPSNADNPFNWPSVKKWRVTLLACFMTFVIQVNGTMMTSAAEQINHSFRISDEEFPHSYWPILSWSLGGAVAPLTGLPIMENFGVKWSYMAIHVILIVFIVSQATSKNFATLIVTRIITGACSGVLANITSGIVSDIWEAGRAKSFGTALYIWGLLAGLSMGPVFGSLVLQYTTWRWIFITQIIFYSALLPVLYLLLPEVRPVVILAGRSHHMDTDKTLAGTVSNENEMDRKSFREILRETLIRPSHMLFTESVVLFFGLWSAFCIGVAFMFTQSIVQVYSEIYGWSWFGTGLVQSAIVIGELIGLGASLFQDRLYFLSGPLLFAWTSYSEVHWVVPTVALVFIGFGMFCSTAAVTTYVVDAYAKYAASAVAGIAFLENIMAAFLPLATQSLYRTLGFQWASSLLGFTALALSFIPLVLLRYGKAIRAKSPFMSQARYEEE